MYVKFLILFLSIATWNLYAGENLSLAYSKGNEALEKNDTTKAISILLPAYQHASQSDENIPQIAFLLGVSYLREKDYQNAYDYFSKAESKFSYPAAKGKVTSTKELIQNAKNDHEKQILERRFLDDIQAQIELSPNANERQTLLKLQAQTLTNLLEIDSNSLHIIQSKSYDMNVPPAQRAIGLLQQAYYFLLKQQDITSFHRFVQQACKVDPSLADIDALQLSLFHAYYNASQKDSLWTPVAAASLINSYKDFEPLPPPYDARALQLADNLTSLIQVSSLDKLPLQKIAPPHQENAKIVARLYSHLPEHQDKAIALLASIGDKDSLSKISDPEWKEHVNTYLSYYYNCNGKSGEACGFAATSMNSKNPKLATIAALTYASASWRGLAKNENSSPDSFMLFLEILANIKNRRDVATEPWNAEAALEYTLAAAHLLSKETDGATQAALLVDKVYGEYFDQEVPENKKYWDEVKKDPQLNLILQPYAAFFNAESAYWRSKSFSQQGKADFALNWSRKAAQQYKNALASSKGKTLFLTQAAEQRLSTLTQNSQ